ncbi:CidA/LrgA family protein [Salmonella enterica subsp. enterica serovar Mbandaka]|nr:CidA/LrgA family protein [Salmonella enterica subsp. enterica serovar Mbandaka]EED9866623.1 CidA/LrgA family protein [Salmonella enterica subsp. enterica serovar Mbandaka]
MSITELPSARPLVPVRRWLRGSRLWQVLLIVGLWAGAEWLVQATHLPIPSGIVGMMILLLLLGRQWVAPQTVSKGAGWLLAEMLLFFVPAAMILMQNPQMFGLLGLKLLAIIVVGTILVMAATALTIDVLFRWRQRHETR